MAHTWQTSKEVNNYKYHGRFRTASFLLLYFSLLSPAGGTVTGRMELVLTIWDKNTNLIVFFIVFLFFTKSNFFYFRFNISAEILLLF